MLYISGDLNKSFQEKNIKIIEDSVDSIILHKNDLFTNKGDFEIVSLPKIIGSISGGIIITKNKSFYEFAKKEQDQNRKLGQYQSRRKFDDINKKNHLIPGYIMKAQIHI